MIIFNALAIVVGLIIGLFVGPLFYFFPEFMDSTQGNVLSCVLITVISIASDLVGLKGRVFFLPIWVFGLIGMGVNLHTIWGWWGPALAATLVVVLLGGLMLMGAWSERKDWAEAPANLNAARDSLAKGVSEETWELLAKAFFVPAWGGDTAERCRHNLEVLAVARKAMPENAGALGLRIFDALNVAYRAGLAPVGEGSEKVQIPTEFSAAMVDILNNKGQLPEEEDRKDLLEELNKAAGLPATT